ncbi:MAG: ABC transporter ATP-binding protein, partial [Clostridiales bacterium]|nr:ABC transporter ATP-binding protein [Clostridiales bacterium]
LYPYMTVNEHLGFVCSLRGIRGSDVRPESARVCELLSITDVAHRAIGQLSKGYRQRVGFAAALIGKPKLLILDEPTVGLDPQQVIEIRSLIRSLSKQMTVIISSHILTEIAGVCSRLLFLFEGVLLADGTMEAITKTYSKSISTAVSVRAAPEAAQQVMQACAQQHGFAIQQTHFERGETHFVIQSPEGTPAEEIIFCAFAPFCPDMAITQLYTPAPSLEDIFLDITKAWAGQGKGEDA